MLCLNIVFVWIEIATDELA